MTNDAQVLRQHIQSALNASVGRYQAVSFEEAAQLCGINAPTLYQIKRGELEYPERHLPALLDIPPFTERYMTLRGYACAHVGNEADSCPWSIAKVFMSVVGWFGKALKDGHFCHKEQADLATKVLPPVIRQAVAYVHRHRSA